MSKKEEKACFAKAEAIAASRLRRKDRLIAIVKQDPEVVKAQDAEGDSLPSTVLLWISTEQIAKIVFLWCVEDLCCAALRYCTAK